MPILKIVHSLFFSIFLKLVEIWSQWREWCIMFSVKSRRHLTRHFWKHCSAELTWMPILDYMKFTETSKMVIIAFSDIWGINAFYSWFVHFFIDNYFIEWLQRSKHNTVLKKTHMTVSSWSWHIVGETNINQLISQMIPQAGPELCAKKHRILVSTFFGETWIILFRRKGGSPLWYLKTYSKMKRYFLY